jgi:hypothetical protein
MDFAGPQRSPSRPGLLALAAGTALLCASMGYSEDVSEAVTTLEAELTSLDGQGREERLRQAARGARRPGELDDRVRKANAVIQHLALPWDSLFAALEQASGDGVALLSLEPGPVSRHASRDRSHACRPPGTRPSRTPGHPSRRVRSRYGEVEYERRMVRALNEQG